MLETLAKSSGWQILYAVVLFAFLTVSFLDESYVTLLELLLNLVALSSPSPNRSSVLTVQHAQNVFILGLAAENGLWGSLERC